MTRLVSAAIAAIMLLASPAAAQDAAQIDALFAKWASPATPGCAVAVAQDGTTILDRAYGSADLEHGIANSSATIFEAGSVSKQFTAAAILLLAEDGKLALTDDVRKFVPELPRYGRTITIAHLLSHTSGLRDWGVVAEIAGWPRGTRAHTQADVLDIASRQKSLNYLPGAEYSYTNTGYNLMAMIVERVSGSSLADFTRDRLFRPLEMANTAWRDDFRRIVRNRAIAYGRRGSGEYAQEMPFEDAYGNGGLLTTTGDLLIWNEAVASGRLGPFLTAELHRRAVLNDGRRIPYARGIIIGNYKGREEIHHSGSTGGYRAWLARYPAEKLSVAMLCNAGDASPAELGHRLADRFLAAAAPAPAVQGLSARAAERAGMYVNERTGIPLALVAEGDRLRIDKGPFLDPLGPDRLRSPGGEVIFESPRLFRLNSSDGETVRFRRVQPASPTAAQLAALAGRYVSDEAGAAFRVSVKDKSLVLQLERRPEAVETLVPVYRDAFRSEDGIVRFYRNAKGKVVALGIGVPRVRDLRFTRR